ncbi:MAG: amidohydrolase family protein, partial [Nannocystaceae bacterium]|nr:amidohydrolase family protein [Nannocystaceae bacterium]
AFSTTAAYATHREGHLGVLRPGMQADVTCFAEDLRSITPRAIHGARVSATIVAGRLAYVA